MVSGLPRFSGGWLPPDNALVAAMDASGGGGGGGNAPGGLRDLAILLAGGGGGGIEDEDATTSGFGPLRERSPLTAPPAGGGGGPPEGEDAETSCAGGLRLIASASCAREMASFSVSMPMSTWAFLAASINWFVLKAGTGIAVGTGMG